MMNERKKTAPKDKAEHEIRSGEIGILISLRQSNSGFSYYSYRVVRCWSARATGKETHGCSFFDSDEEDIVQGVRQASEWIPHEALWKYPSEGDEPQ